MPTPPMAKTTRIRSTGLTRLTTHAGGITATATPSTRPRAIAMSPSNTSPLADAAENPKLIVEAPPPSAAECSRHGGLECVGIDRLGDVDLEAGGEETVA